MTKEKTNLIKTLKDENLRAETHKYTQNLLNNHKNRSLTVPVKNNKNEIANKILNNNDSKIKENNNIIKNNDGIKVENNDINKNKNENENNKIKKKKKVKKKMKIKKGEQLENIEKEQKLKL